MLLKTAQGVTSGEENEQMSDGQDWVCFDVEREYCREEDEVRRAYRLKRQHGKKTASGEGVPGFERMNRVQLDMAAASQLATGKYGGKSSKSQQQR